MELDLKQDITAANDAQAAINRKAFNKNRVFVINLLGSPGAGKTRFLEKVLTELKDLKIAVIEGDLATAKDAKRIADTGTPVIQINTNGGCHLDAQMIDKVLGNFDLGDLDLLIIENVGNLVCPAAFDLGEDLKMVVLSIAEGGDKPSKYPRTFWESKVTIINKTDLLPFCDGVNLDELHSDIKDINKNMVIFNTSCREGEGINEAAAWLKEQVEKKRG